jgi:uncharacterized protein (DUF1499 family)
MALISCKAELPTAVPGHLQLCPASPNCVSSEAYVADATHYIAALQPPPGQALPNDALVRLRTIVAGMPRATIVGGGPTWFTATFSSRIWGFVDDVELRVDGAAGVVHVRSASRTGHSDLGVNRERVEAIRAAWVASFPPVSPPDTP